MNLDFSSHRGWGRDVFVAALTIPQSAPNVIGPSGFRRADNANGRVILIDTRYAAAQAIVVVSRVDEKFESEMLIIEN